MTNTDNRILGYGVAGSLAMHVLLFIALALSMGMVPMREITRPIPEPEPVVTMVFPQDIEVLPPLEIPKPKPTHQPESQRYIRTTQNEGVATAPKNADFESDRNTVASAKLAPDQAGVAGLPTLNGVNTTTTELAHREYKDGEIQKDRELSPPPAPKIESSPPEPLLQKTVTENTEHLPPEIRRPGDSPEPAPEMKTPDELPVPKATAARSYTDNNTPIEKDFFVPQTFTSEVKGTLNNGGNEDAVNAAATPRGRYESQVQAAIEQKWKQILKQEKFMVDPGKLGLHFYVDRNGKINPDDLLIIFNEADADLTKIARRSILEAEIPPIPDELLPTLEQGRFGTGYNAVITEPKNARAGQ